MAGSSALAENVWPGYVAAMASLLLSLLLVSAVLVMTIGQIGEISDKYLKSMVSLGFSSSKEILLVAKKLGVDVDQILAMQGQKTSNVAIANNQGDTKLVEKSTETIAVHEATGLRKYINFDYFTYDKEVASQVASELLQADKNLLALIDLSNVQLANIKFNSDVSNLDLASEVANKLIREADFSKVDFGGLQNLQIEKVKPFLARMALEILINENKIKTGKPLPELIKLPQYYSDNKFEIVLTYLDRYSTLTSTQQESLRVLLEKSYEKNSFLFLAVDDFRDVAAREVRSSYAQLMSVRSIAVSAGWNPSQIKVKYQKNRNRAEVSLGASAYIMKISAKDHDE